MGNRCVITTAPFDATNVGIYLHWNGGIESVEAFCAAAKELGYRDPTKDCYGTARLTGLISLYFDITGETSLGVDKCENLDMDGDNGTWLLGPGWKIVGWRERSDVVNAKKPPKNREPGKTALIYKQLIVGAECDVSRKKNRVSPVAGNRIQGLVCDRVIDRHILPRCTRQWCEKGIDGKIRR